MDKLFKFKGRADKLEFVKTLGILYLIAFVVKYINYDVLNAGNNVLLISIYVLLAVSSTAAFFRRLHDIGLPGYISFTSWILLTLIIPSDYLGGIVCSVFWGYIAFFVYLIIRDSQPYSNKYGESLKVLDKQDIVHSEIKNRQMINKIILSMLGLKTIIKGSTLCTTCGERQIVALVVSGSSPLTQPMGEYPSPAKGGRL